jgi:hypothetical protein
MAVAFDAFSNVAAGTGNLSWTHTPVGTPRGVIVQIAQYGGVDPDQDDVASVTYGGVSMAEAALSPVEKDTGEVGIVYEYFLGASIPTGAQTVAVTTNGKGISKRAAAITLTAAQDTSVVDTSIISQDTGANPSVVVSLGGIECFVAEVFVSGQAAVTGITELTNWTARLEHDFGAGVAGWYTYNIIGTADVTAGYTATTEDCILHAIAVREDAGGGGGSPTFAGWISSSMGGW